MSMAAAQVTATSAEFQTDYGAAEGSFCSSGVHEGVLLPQPVQRPLHGAVGARFINLRAYVEEARE
jgi:hypothetical protein